MCTVSVIIPVYNRKDDLMIPVNSILEQEYGDYELLLIDDGSKDGSAELCDTLAEKYDKIRTVHQENGGVSKARNTGIANANGEYILFLDSDDWLDADTLGSLVERIRRDGSDIAMFAMNIDRFTGDTVNSTTTVLYGEDAVLNKKDLAARFVDLYNKDYLCSSCTKLFKKEIIKSSALLFREDLVMYEDFYFVMDYLSRASSVSVVDHAYYHYRMDESVVMINKRRTDDLFVNLDTVAKRIISFTESMGISKNPEVSKIVFEFYIMYFYKLFVTELSYSERLREIRRSLKSGELKEAEKLSRGTDGGKFYKLLRLAVRFKCSGIVYVLYRNKYKS